MKTISFHLFTFTLLLTFLTLPSFSCSRTSTATLLQVKDKLYIYDEDNYMLTSISLRPFPFIKEVLSLILHIIVCFQYNSQWCYLLC